MITVTHAPHNHATFVRLIALLKDVMAVCHHLQIDPVLDGSLAVFAYTGDRALTVNDVDLSCSEAEFPRLMRAFDERGIDYRLREWHVLQIVRDGAKIELGSTEYWYRHVPLSYEIVQIDTVSIRMLSLASLRALYRQAIKDRAHKPGDQEKRADLERKYAMLEELS